MTINDVQGSSYQILTPDLSPDLTLEAVSLDQLRKLPGGTSHPPVTVNYNVASGKTIALRGYASTKPSHNRYLQGAGVTNPGTADAQRVLTGTGSFTVTLGNGFWTIS